MRLQSKYCIIMCLALIILGSNSSFRVYFFFAYTLCNLKLHSYQTADQPPTNADQFLRLGRVRSDKKLPPLPPLIEEHIYPPLYPRCIPDVPSLKYRSSRPTPSFRLTNPRSARQVPTSSWFNYAHYAQYRTSPWSVCLMSTPSLKWIIQANVMPIDSNYVQYPKCAYGPYC